MPKRGFAIKDTAKTLIEERGPLTVDELAVEMVALGRTRAKDPVAAVRSAIERDARLVENRDGRWFSLVAQLEGAIFTVAPTALERDQGIVLVREDLDLVRRVLAAPRWWAEVDHKDGVHLDLFGAFFGLPWPVKRYEEYGEDDDTFVEEVVVDLREYLAGETRDQLLGFLDELGFPRDDDEDSLLDLVDELYMSEVVHGPAGWMPTLRSREALGLEIRGGMVRAVAIDKRAMKGMHLEAAVTRVGAIAHEILDVDGGLGAPAVSIEDLLEFVVTEAPDLFRRPLPPLGHLLERAGFEVEDGLVGLPGAAWDDIRWALDPDPEAAWGFEPGDALH